MFGYWEDFEAAGRRMTAWFGPDWLQVIMDSTGFRFAALAVAAGCFLRIGYLAQKGEREGSLHVDAERARRSEIEIEAWQQALVVPILIAKTNAMASELRDFARYIQSVEVWLETGPKQFEDWWMRDRQWSEYITDDERCKAGRNYDAILPVPTFLFIQTLPGFPDITEREPIIDSSPAPQSSMNANRTSIKTYLMAANATFLSVHRANFKLIRGWLGQLKLSYQNAEAECVALNQEVANRIAKNG